MTTAVSGIPTASERGGKSEVSHLWQSGYVTAAISGITTASERGAKAEGANLWAKWLRHPCRLGDPSFNRLSLGRAAGAHYPLAVAAGPVGLATRNQFHSARSCELTLRVVGWHEAARGGLSLAWV